MKSFSLAGGWRRLALPVALLSLLAGPVGATWSIIVLDTRTGEVAVASATCLTFFDLERELPVVLVGVGGGVAQAATDGSGVARTIMWNGFLAGDTPQDILNDVLSMVDAPQVRQYGIASFDGPPVSWSGIGTLATSHGVVGTVGDLRYAIQGNILTGNEVVDNAESALINTPGDLGQKVMAAMEAARAMGGDKRCSCTLGVPCTAPPPGFTKSAHVGFVVVARIGDADGGCTTARGCADGDYYLNIEVIAGAAAPDPVLTLQTKFDAWRAALAGSPDHILSTVDASAASLPADGRTQATMTVRLVDVNGIPLTGGGATVSVAPASGGTPFASAGPVADNGDGSYTFALTAGTQAGADSFVITADDGVVKATLYPYLDLRVDPARPLHAGFDQVSATSGGTVPFTIDLGPAEAGAAYILLASASGTTPGSLVGNLLLPLNPDWLFLCTASQAGSAVLPGSIGVVDGGGRASASMVAAPGLLTAMVGMRFDWATLYLGAMLGVTNVAGFDIVP